MSRLANVTMRPDVRARARAIIARALSRPLNFDTSEWSEDAPTVKPKVWNHAENYKARQKAFRAYAKQEVAKKALRVLFWWFLYIGGYGIAATHGPFRDENECNLAREWVKTHSAYSVSWCWFDGQTQQRPGQ